MFNFRFLLSSSLACSILVFLERFYIIHIPEHLILINIFTICNLLVVMLLYSRRSRYESCVRLRVSHMKINISFVHREAKPLLDNSETFKNFKSWVHLIVVSGWSSDSRRYKRMLCRPSPGQERHAPCQDEV